MCHEEYTAELLNTAARDLDADIYVRWDGDGERTTFEVFFEEELTPYTIHDIGREFEIWHSVPGSRDYTQEVSAARPKDVIAELIDLLREKD